MTRFDERRTIDHLAEAGPLNPDLVDAIADAIAASHRVAALAPAEPWLKSIPAFIDGNSKAFRAVACFSAVEINDIEEASRHLGMHFSVFASCSVSDAGKDTWGVAMVTCI
jgi:aminoglycoside phosphotransferase family enzyme